MTEPYIGEIQLFAFPFAPEGWAFCNGATLPLQQFSTLFSLIGVQYGGNATSNFQLPNFTARAGTSQGTGPGLTPRTAGTTFGAAQVTLTAQQLPAHSHPLTAFISTDTTKRSSVPTSGGSLSMPGLNANKPFGGFKPVVPNVPLPAQMVQPAGGGLAHDNQQPYLAVNFCIALRGVFPSFD